MLITAIKTHPIHVGESLLDLLDTTITQLSDKSVLAITSKIISLCQTRVIAKSDVADKYELIKREADAYLEEPPSLSYNIQLTIKNNLLIPSAGIDESNGGDFYILYPSDAQQTAAEIWNHLRTRFNIKHLGIIITDSHTTPLRRGVTGIALGWCGFEPLYSYVGKPDIFGKPLRVTYINNIDALAATAVFVMGEGNEQTPIALIENLPRLKFSLYSPTAEEEEMVNIPLETDLYAPLLSSVKWKRNKK